MMQICLIYCHSTQLFDKCTESKLDSSSIHLHRRRQYKPLDRFLSSYITTVLIILNSRKRIPDNKLVSHFRKKKKQIRFTNDALVAKRYMGNSIFLNLIDNPLAFHEHNIFQGIKMQLTLLAIKQCNTLVDTHEEVKA